MHKKIALLRFLKTTFHYVRLFLFFNLIDYSLYYVNLFMIQNLIQRLNYTVDKKTIAHFQIKFIKISYMCLWFG